jgi:predicted nucleic acid-binding protein
LRHSDTEYQIVPLTRLVIGRAVTLTQQYRLRGYDAVQLATALIANDGLTAAGLAAAVFVAADNDLLTAARAEGLAAENPRDHP